MLGLSFNILRVANIPIRVHWTFGFFFLWIIYLGNQTGMSYQGVLRLSVFALVLFACVVLHELGHSLTARRFNVETKDIIISPIGGVARLLKMPENPREEFIIAIAGPLVNFAIAVVLGIYLLVFTEQGLLPVGSPEMIFELSSNFLPALFLLNTTLIIFNLLPAFPMDGGRIFRSLLSMRFGKEKATLWASRTGQLIAIFFMGAGLYIGDYLLVVIGLFVFFSAASENSMVRAEVGLQKGVVRDILRSDYTLVKESDLMSHVIDIVDNGEEEDFIVSRADGDVMGVLHREFITEAKKQQDHELRVSEYLSSRFEPISSQRNLEETLRLFQENGYSILPVFDGAALIGVVDRRALQRFIDGRRDTWMNWKSRIRAAV